MTRDEILNMPAGYEMNKLIAELVFGMKLEKNHGLAGGFYWVGNGVQFGDVRAQHVPDYSGDMNVAWSVIEKLERHLDEILFKITRLGATMEKLRWMAEFRECRGRQKYHVSEADTAPLAICRAALLAMVTA